MPVVTCRALLCVVALTFVRVGTCHAQQLWPLSFETNVGAGFGSSSAPHGSSGGFSADALLGFRFSARAPLVIALSGSGQAPALQDASCIILPDGTCPPDFPVFWIVSALAGLETREGGTRFLIGPAVGISSSQRVAAAQARMDFALPAAAHISFIVSGRYAYVPRYRGDSFRLGALGLGLRIR